MSTVKYLAVALMSSFALAFYAWAYAEYEVQISQAPFSYRVIWYLILGSLSFISVSSLAAGLLKWRRE